MPYLLLIFLLTIASSSAQATGKWIGPSKGEGTTYGVYYFAKEISVASVPQKAELNISADNRYILYLNGEELARGPSRGSVDHRYYETVPLREKLLRGKNRLSVVVWNFGAGRPAGEL